MRAAGGLPTACLAQLAALPVTRLNRFGARRGWAAAGCAGAVGWTGAAGTGAVRTGAGCTGAGAVATKVSTGGGAT